MSNKDSQTKSNLYPDHSILMCLVFKIFARPFFFFPSPPTSEEVNPEAEESRSEIPTKDIAPMHSSPL